MQREEYQDSVQLQKPRVVEFKPGAEGVGFRTVGAPPSATAHTSPVRVDMVVDPDNEGGKYKIKLKRFLRKPR